jgi:hypothetical protein
LGGTMALPCDDDDAVGRKSIPQGFAKTASTTSLVARALPGSRLPRRDRILLRLKAQALAPNVLFFTSFPSSPRGALGPRALGAPLSLSPSAIAQSDADRATARELGLQGFAALDAKDYATAEDRLRACSES